MHNHVTTHIHVYNLYSIVHFVCDLVDNFQCGKLLSNQGDFKHDLD